MERDQVFQTNSLIDLMVKRGGKLTIRRVKKKLARSTIIDAPNDEYENYHERPKKIIKIEYEYQKYLDMDALKEVIEASIGDANAVFGKSRPCGVKDFVLEQKE